VPLSAAPVPLYGTNHFLASDDAARSSAFPAPGELDLPGGGVAEEAVLREDISVVAQRIAGDGDHVVFRFPDDRHEAVGIVRLVEDLRDAARLDVRLEIPHPANVPHSQLPLEVIRGSPRMLVDEALHVELRPAGFRELFRDDGAHNDERP